MKCLGCCSTNLHLEHGDWICADCGLTVKQKGQFEVDVNTDELKYVNNNYFDDQNVPNDVKRSIHKPVSARACKNGLERTKRIAEYFNFTSTMIQSVTDIYHSLARSTKFIKRYLKSKLILGGVVIMIVANQSGLVIPIEKICERVGCFSSEFKAVYNMVIESNPSLKPTPKSITELIPFIANEANFNDSERDTIKERCKRLVQLISEGCGVEGKNPTHIIHASLCLAWKSVNPRERGIHRFSLKKFCSLVNIPYSDTGAERLKEQIAFLTLLAIRLPWNKLTMDVIQENVSLHLVDILNHSAIVIDRFREERTPRQSVKIQETSNLMATYRPVGQPIEEPEISDKEIESYIRSDEEIKFIQKLHQEIDSLKE